MYSREYFAVMERITKQKIVVFACVVALCAVAYIAAAVAGMQWLMLGVLLTAFLFAVFYGDLKLLPMLRCRRFLREMQAGLRRNLDCTVDVRGSEAQMKDGLRVFAQQVRLADGDTRIFYLNVDYGKQFPVPGTAIRLESYGRHITGFEILTGGNEAC